MDSPQRKGMIFNVILHPIMQFAERFASLIGSIQMPESRRQGDPGVEIIGALPD